MEAVVEGADQANAIVNILKSRFGENYGDENFVIAGDLNDYLVEGEESQSGITPLLTNEQLVNVVDRLPKDQRWTHYYKRDKSYNQLDYLLLSNALAQKNPTAKPYIERRGLPPRVNQSGQPKRVDRFFRGVTNYKKASDHCPVAITINV